MMIQDKLRACHVTRWHIVQTQRQQTLAEHQYNVAIIAVAIAAKLSLPQTIQDEVMRYAMTHDLDEVVNGDVPSPLKDKLGMLPHHPNGSTVLQIVKAADYMEALWFIDDNWIGRHGQAVYYDVRSRYERHLEKLPEDVMQATSDVYRDIKFGEHAI